MSVKGRLARYSALCGRAREPASERPIYRLELRPEPGCINPTYALRQLLKRALRDYGLRCVSVEEVR